MKENLRVSTQRTENIRMGHCDYSDYIANLQNRVHPIRHTPLLRDCVHTHTCLFKIPLRQPDTGYRCAGTRHLPVEYFLRLSLAALAGAKATLLPHAGLFPAAAMVWHFSCGDVFRQNSIPAGE